jgi:DHA2 family multidrug resistance protein
MKNTSWLIVVTAVLASLLEIIDSSIVNVAIPHMQGNLGVTIEEVTWVSTGYIISNAVVLPIAAWLGMRIGRKKYFTGCILLFTLSSLLCGIAPSFAFLVAARVLQGMAGGALLPTSQSIIQEQFPGEKSGTGSAIYGMSVMVGPAIGPTLGGYLTDHFNWRAIFFINLPVGIVATILSYMFIEDEAGGDEAAAKKRKMDVIGFSLLIVGIGALQFMLERGQQDDWFSSPLILIAGVLTACAIPIFYAWERNNKDPIVNVKLFDDSPVRNGSMLMALTGMVLYAVIFLIPIYTDNALGMDATHTGLLYVPGTLVTIATMPFVGKFLPIIGPKPFIVFGITMVAMSLYLLSQFTTQAGSGDILFAFYFRGVGLGCIFVPINAMVLSQYSGESLGQVSGLLNLSRQIGGSIGIAGISTFLDRYSAQYRNDLRAHVTTVSPETIQKLHQSTAGIATKLQTWVGSNLGVVGFNTRTAGAIKGIMGQMEKQVFQLSFNRLMIIIMSAYLVSFIPLYSLKLKKKVAGPVGAA